MSSILIQWRMDRVDTRRLTAEAREELRRAAVRMYKRGRTHTAIAEELGIRRPTISAWIRAYQASGSKALKEAARGRPIGTGRTLSAAQEQQLQREIVDKTPDQLKLRFALWSAQAVRLLIRQNFGIDMPARTVRKYLKRWGFTPQRPMKRAYERDPKAVEQWLKTDFPAIAARAKAEGGEIHWGDETAASSVEHYPRGYAPKGQTPVMVLSQCHRHRVNVISAITNQGTVRFMMYRKTLTAAVLIRFLERLIRDAGRKVFLVLDNLRVHHSRKVRDWLEDKREHIELFFLPSYAPDLNPDEYLNCDLKARLNAAEPVRSDSQLKTKVLSHLRTLQRSPDRVKAYFQNEHIRYAA
jgi:transposase